MELKNIPESIRILNNDSKIDDTIKKIAKDSQSEPFLICNIGDILEKFENWKTIFPTVQTYFTLQSNDFPIIVETLAALDCRFFCASQIEIKKILNLNVSPSRLLFGNPTKPISHIKYAANTGVSLLVFDNEMELYKIKDYHPYAKLILRINIICKPKDRNIFRKFGCDPNTESLELLKLAKALGLNIVGVSFHLGSYGNKNPQAYSMAIKSAKEVFDIGSSLGFNMDILDIGGGFPNDITEIGDCINNAIKQYFSSKTMQILAEPGSFFVNSSFHLAAKIHSKKTISKSDLSRSQTRQMYYINSGVYQMLMPIYYHSRKYVLRPLKVNQIEERFKSIVWGPTCDALDKLADCALPEMNIGDWVIIDNIGSYTWSQATNWNGFLIPKVHCIIHRKYYSQFKELSEKSELLSKLKYVDLDD